MGVLNVRQGGISKVGVGAVADGRLFVDDAAVTACCIG